MRIEVMYRLTIGQDSTEIGPFKSEGESLAANPAKHMAALRSQADKPLRQALQAAAKVD